ncbi:hypothetical protein L1049_023886 [Liquidambar formosana]|uniref:ENTH domain-containing protein n=1 Tax=Liquidambar formosana TaxID=63359 RepID=A0AAP0X4B4_LIQFO
MGQKTKLRDLIGAIKDKASLSKAAFLSKPNTLSLQLSILRATTHDPTNPPHDKHLTTLLSFGQSSRATASAVIESLMDRLHHTHDSSVALKCLITIHHIIRRGSFILQDQLCVYPTFGGRNYLKLSDFRDCTTPTTWALSSWVRWYAQYVEHLLCTSRILGFFLCSTSGSADKDEAEEKVAALLNKDLLKEIDSLVGIMEEICKAPEFVFVEGNKLVLEVMGFVGDDYLSAINEISLRICEFKERLSCLSFGESVELVFELKRLEDCKERLMVVFTRTKASVEIFWGLVREMKDRVGMMKGYREERRLVMVGRRERASESARFGERVLKSGDLVNFSSGRLCLDRFQFPLLESIESEI